jgi:hypothetical protein
MEDLEVQKDLMSEKRTLIGKFIHTTWTNLNIRSGKYKHLQTGKTKNKCQKYHNVKICFTREEFKNWCYKNETSIKLCVRPSINRKNSDLDYTLENIEVIELVDNIRLKQTGNTYLNGPKSRVKRGIRKQGKKWSARIQINKKEKHLGTFTYQEEALNAFKNAYYQHYKKYPF